MIIQVKLLMYNKMTVDRTNFIIFCIKVSRFTHILSFILLRLTNF